MANPNCEQEAFAEVTVIDSQFQHFSSYIDVIRVFKCRICSFCSPLEHVIASHMSEVHFPRRNYLCKQCLFVFEDRDQLTSHLESAHGTKSINVCFGDTPPNYASPPPSWRATRSEDDGMSRLTVENERGLDEGRNGRVTSSTGNLANLKDDVTGSPNNQTEKMEHSGSAPLPEPQQQQSQGQSPGGSPHNKYLGNGSCHPSSSSQEECEIVGTQPAKDLAPGETPIQRQENQDYIKAEPVSPARRNFPPRISVESFDEPRTEISPGKQAGNLEGAAPVPRISPVVSNHHCNEQVVSRAARMLNRSTTIALSPTGDSEHELALARPVQPSFTSYIIRQSSFESGEDSGLSAGTPPDVSDRANPQDPASGASADPRMPPSQISPIYKQRQGLGGRMMTIRRQESIEEGRYGQMEVREPVEPAATVANQVQVQNRPTAEVPPVTQPSETRSRSHRLTFKQMANQMLQSQEKRSLDPSQPLSLDLGNGAFPGMAGLQRAGRPRSFSISEGDTRALYSGLNSEYPAMAAVRVPGATTERERHPYGLHLQPGWHPYPGLGYQSLSVDAGASKYWSFPNQGSRGMNAQEEGSSQTASQGEENRDQNGPMEGSVLYKALQSHEGNKQGRRNPNNTGNAPGAEGPPRPNQQWQHPWTQRRGLSEMAHRMPWNQRSPPYPLLNQREHSVESLPPSSLKNGSDSQQIFHHKRFRSMERSASEGHNSTANPHRKVGGPGISSESSQDLAQADDITRQVQQVMEGSNTMYPSRDKAVPIWTEEQHSPQGGSMDSIDKDSDLRRRSRKSTFNIYREIPERKRKLDRDEEEKIKHSYNPDGSFDYFTLTGWKAYKCDLCKKRRFKTASELEDHKRRKHGSLDISPYSASAGSPSNIKASPSSVANTSLSSATTITTAVSGIPNGTTTTMTTTSATASPTSVITEFSSDSNKSGEESTKSTGASSG